METNLSVEWVGIATLKPNAKNKNKHSAEQVERLAELIKFHGWRIPIVVSKRSGLIVCGHGRLLAAKKLKLKQVPVSFQDFESEEAEQTFGISDNAIAAWAELDLSAINMELPEWGPDFPIDMLGLKDFELEPAEKIYNEKEIDENLETDHECPSCGYKWS